MAVSQGIQEKLLEEAYSVTPNYDINYNDPRFGKVETQKQGALDDLNNTYSDMIANSDDFYQKQINASKDWADTQTQLQKEQTAFEIEQINQQKDQAHKDYLKEQSGAYVDWQKQSNKYGAAAEQMASAGLTNTGFSESSQVSMYNTYQNRVATARESFERARLNYDNAIREAQLQNNAALAEIAYQSLQQQLELSLAGFQYKNQLILEQANKKTELDNMYYNRYQDVLEQINTENAIKEDIRQYNETQKWNTEQAELDRAFQADQAQKNRDHDKTMAQIEYDYQVKLDEADRTFEEEQAKLDREHDLALVEANTRAAIEKANNDHANEMKKLEQEHENEIARINAELAAEKELLAEQRKSVGTVSGGSSGKTVSGTAKSGGSVAWDTFTNRVTNNPRTSKFTGSTYDSAVSYLKSKGVSTAGVLTASEWSRRKSSYAMTGIGNAAVKNYSSYAAYLQAYVNSTVANK